MFKSLIQRLGVVVVVGLVAACGGGGGGDSCNPLLSSCTGSGGGGTTLVPTATISLADDSGSASDRLIFGKPLSVKLVARDGSGNPIKGAVVTFEAQSASSIAEVAPTTALTNDQGVAVTTLSALTPSAAGAFFVAGTFDTVGGETATDRAAVQANASNVTGTVGNPAYLQFVSASPATLVLSTTNGTGWPNLSQTSQVKFKVFDIDDNPVSSARVDLKLSNYLGGLKINGGTTASLFSDTNGEVTATVTAGSTPISLWVEATLPTSAEPTRIYRSGVQIVVSTGFPDESHFAISHEANSSCGKPAEPLTYPCLFILTVADSLAQPVPDGTQVLVVANNGLVVGDVAGQPTAACATVSGVCQVEFRGDIRGVNELVAYTRGVGAPAAPVAFSLTGTQTILPLPSAADYIRANIIY